jgi:PKHD-type hydroxylase
MKSASHSFLRDHRLNFDHMNYYYFPSVFTDEEIEKIKELGNALPQQRATVVAEDNELKSTDYRESEVAWMADEPKFRWIYDKITACIKESNSAMWNYDISGYDDELQFTTYYDNNGHYDWHVDFGPTISNRKLSVVVQLTDPEEYEGGELQLLNPHVVSIERRKGMVVVFSSFVLHRVTPVLSGKRQSLVAWLSGPNFR